MSGSTLIDWAGVARNALWIVGLSVALAALSYTLWRASSQRIGFHRALARPAFRMWFSFGLLLFSVGLAWGAIAAWERIAWASLALAFAWQIIESRRSARD